MFKPEEAKKISQRALEAYTRRDVSAIKSGVHNLVRLCLSEDYKRYIVAFVGAPTQVPEGRRVYEPAEAFGFANDATFAVRELIEVRRSGDYLRIDVLKNLSILDAFFQRAPEIAKVVDESLLGVID